MKNRIKNITIILCIAILCIACAYYMHGYSSTVDKLQDAQYNLKIVNNNFNDATANINNLNETLANIKNELDGANEIIESRAGDVYFIDCEVTEYEIALIAKTVLGEAGCSTKLQQSGVVWCILNRVDSGYGTIAEVVLAKNQFHGYNAMHPVEDDIKALVVDVIARWKLEKIGCWNVGRTLPKEYLFFHADGTGFGNSFTTQDPLLIGNYTTWNWDCWNPYE